MWVRGKTLDAFKGTGYVLNKTIHFTHTHVGYVKTNKRANVFQCMHQ